MDSRPQYLQILVCVLSVCLYGATATLAPRHLVYNLTEGQNFTILEDVTVTESLQFIYYYVAVDGYTNKVIKLSKGDDGNGKCYNGSFRQQCESFSLRYEQYGNQSLGVRFTIENVDDSVAGKYQLRRYCDGIANCSEGPIMNFTLFVKDAPRRITDMPETQNTTKDDATVETGLQRTTELPPEIKTETMAPVRNQGSFSDYTPLYIGLSLAFVFVLVAGVVIYYKRKRNRGRSRTQNDEHNNNEQPIPMGELST